MEYCPALYGERHGQRGSVSDRPSSRRRVQDVYKRQAYASYSAGDSAAALQELEAINQDTLSDDAKTLYSSVFSEVGVTAVNDLYKTGYAAYEKGDYDTAIADLGKCYELDNTQGDALYFLARSYHKSGDTENAKIYYQKVIEEFPNTRKATDAEGLMKGL